MSEMTKITEKSRSMAKNPTKVKGVEYKREIRNAQKILRKLKIE